MSEKKRRPAQAFVFPTELPLEKGARFGIWLSEPLESPEIEVFFGEKPAEELTLHAPDRIYGRAPAGKQGPQDLIIRSGKKILLHVQDAVTRSRSPKLPKPTRPKRPGQVRPPSPPKEKDPFKTGPASNWWMLHQDLQHTSNARSASFTSLTPVWQHNFVGFTDCTQPIFAPGLVLVGCGFGGSDEAFTALNFYTGKPVWTRWKADNGNRFVFGTPVAIDGRVYFVEESADGLPALVTCLDVQTGAEIWSTPLPVTWSHTSLASAFGMVYGVSRSGHVGALDAETGALRWRQPLNVGAGSMLSSPAVMFASVYVGSQSGLRVFGAIDGTPGWAATIPSTGTSSPSIVTAVQVGEPAVVAIGADDYSLHAFDAMTGQTKWQYTGNAALYYTTPSSSEDGKFYLRQWRSIVVLDVQSGNVLQTSQDFGVNVISAPIVAGDTVLLVIDADAGHRVLLLDRATLAILDSQPVDAVHSGDGGSLSVLGNYVFVCDSKIVNNLLHASIRCFKGT